MRKRKSDEAEHEEEGLGKETKFTAMDSEDGGEEKSDLKKSGKENLIEPEQSEFLGAEEADDPVGREEEEDILQDTQDSTPFGRAFGKIMKKCVLGSPFTDISGSVLAERKQMLFERFGEADTAAKAKTIGKEEKREVREKGHTLPLTYTDPKEKALMKLATKGVVRLFNAVSKAQTVQADAEASCKAAKASWKQSRAAFMTELRASYKVGFEANQSHENPEQEGKDVEPGWAAFRTDFIPGTSKRLVDWDKGDRMRVTGGMERGK